VNDIRALREFGHDPQAITPVAASWCDRLEIGGIPCVPVEEFLAVLRPTVIRCPYLAGPRALHGCPRSAPRGHRC
jgi:hypothetical protein